jgi:hypothetical protein
MNYVKSFGTNCKLLNYNNARNYNGEDIYYFNYSRSVNNISYDNTGVIVGVSRSTGEVVSVRSGWDDVISYSYSDSVSRGQAFEKYINTVGYNYFVFSHKAYRDYYGDSKWHGPLWVRPYSLYGDLYKDSSSGKHFSQIVGHTHMRQPELKQIGNATVYVLDTLPDFYMTQKYNDNGEIILYELKEFKQ